MDEAQHLTTRAIEQLRTIHDAAKIGLVLLGNLPLIERVDGLGRTTEFAQLFSRIGLRRKIKKPTRGDITAILDAWDVQDGKIRNAAIVIGQRDGGLRSLTKILRNAAKMARATDRLQITMEDFEHSFGEHMTGEFPKSGD